MLYTITHARAVPEFASDGSGGGGGRNAMSVCLRGIDNAVYYRTFSGTVLSGVFVWFVCALLLVTGCCFVISA